MAGCGEVLAPDGAGVEFAAEAEPDARPGAVHVESDWAGGQGDRIAQQRGRVPGWGGVPIGCVRVETDHRVEVNDAACHRDHRMYEWTSARPIPIATRPRFLGLDERYRTAESNDYSSRRALG